VLFKVLFDKIDWKSKEKFGCLHGLNDRMAIFKVIVAILDSILNEQKILKKIAFMVRIAKMASFRPNHKILRK
jgi:hypothetical protein